MNKLKYLAAVLIAVAGLGLQQAQAGLSGPQEFEHSPFTGPVPPATAERQYLFENGYIESCCQFAGRVNAGTNEVIPHITITHTSGSLWHVSWDFTGTGLTLCGLLIKDGNVSPPGNEQIFAFFSVIDNQGVTGAGDVFFNEGRNISYIDAYVCQAGAVPDGGTTVMLLGAGLAALGMVRRYLKS